MSNEDTEEEVENITPGPLADDLASDGYRRTKSGCVGDGEDDECDGLMWYSENMLVCDTCSNSIDLEARRSTTRRDETPWEDYHENPPRYKNSERVRMPGGFPGAYDWVSSDEVDQLISSVDPVNFYR